MMSGSSIGSVHQMIAFAGDLRRDAKTASAPEMAAKLNVAAKQMETTALAQAGITSPHIGKLLDTFA